MSPSPTTVNAARDTIRAQRPNGTHEERTIAAADTGTEYVGVAGPKGPTGAAGTVTGPTGPTGA